MFVGISRLVPLLYPLFRQLHHSQVVAAGVASCSSQNHIQPLLQERKIDNGK